MHGDVEELDGVSGTLSQDRVRVPMKVVIFTPRSLDSELQMAAIRLIRQGIVAA
jgi:hypothetical protein